MHVPAPVVVLVAYSLDYLVFLLWYGGRGRPMTAAEADSLLERVRLNVGAAEGPVVPYLLVHKWAAIEKTHVFPVRAGFSLVLIRVITGGLFAVLGVLTWLGLR